MIFLSFCPGLAFLLWAGWYAWEFHRALAAIAQDRNLMIVGSCLTNFKDEHGEFPPVVTAPGGGVTQSWRAFVAPCLEGSGDRWKYRLEEPWDSEFNLGIAAPVNFGSEEGNDEARVVAYVRKGESLHQPIKILVYLQSRTIRWNAPSDFVEGQDAWESLLDEVGHVHYVKVAFGMTVKRATLAGFLEDMERPTP